MQADLAPNPASLKQSELKGRYTTRGSNAALQDLIGSAGRMIFSISPFATGRSFTGTFFPDPDSGVPQVSFAAARLGAHPMRAKIVNRLKVRGKVRAGRTITIVAKFINRGPGTVLSSSASVLVGVLGDVESGELSAGQFKGIGSDCESTFSAGQRFQASCPVEYVGPPQANTNVVLPYRVSLSDTAGGSSITVQATLVGANTDSTVKSVVVKVAGGGDVPKKPAGSGFYTGSWRCPGLGTLTMTHKGNDVTSGTFGSETPGEGWFPPGNGTVQRGFVTLETGTATIRLGQNTGGHTQADVKMADDRRSFTGNFLMFDANLLPIGQQHLTCVKQ